MPLDVPDNGPAYELDTYAPFLRLTRGTNICTSSVGTAPAAMHSPKHTWEQRRLSTQVFRHLLC